MATSAPACFAKNIRRARWTAVAMRGSETDLPPDQVASSRDTRSCCSMLSETHATIALHMAGGGSMVVVALAQDEHAVSRTDADRPVATWPLLDFVIVSLS
jgi:hypothetical protein